MKKVLLFAIMAAATGIASAQVKFGAKAGLNLSSVSVSPKESGVSYKIAPGFNAGFLANISLPGKFSLQPEVVYSGQGTKVSSTEGSGNYNLGLSKIGDGSFSSTSIKNKVFQASLFYIFGEGKKK